MRLARLKSNFLGTEYTVHFDYATQLEGFKAYVNSLIENTVWFDVDFIKVSDEEGQAILEKERK